MKRILVALLVLMSFSAIGSAAVTVTLGTPANQSSTTDTTPDFNWTVVGDNSTYACTILVNDTLRGTNSSTLNNTATIKTSNSTLSAGVYTWYVNCTVDAVSGVSSARTLTIATTTTTTTTPSGYTATYNISDMTPIAVDLMGTALVALKPNVTNVVDLGVLGFLVSLMCSAGILMIGGVATLASKIPKR